VGVSVQISERCLVLKKTVNNGTTRTLKNFDDVFGCFGTVTECDSQTD